MSTPMTLDQRWEAADVADELEQLPDTYPTGIRMAGIPRELTAGAIATQLRGIVADYLAERPARETTADLWIEYGRWALKCRADDLKEVDS